MDTTDDIVMIVVDTAGNTVSDTVDDTADGIQQRQWTACYSSNLQ